MRGVAVELLPALDRPLAQLLAAAEDVEVAAALTLPDRQRQSPVALLRDHPVVHVAEPVKLAVFAEFRYPADLLGDGQQRPAQPIHADVPLIHQPEDERRGAAPALRVAVRVFLQPIEAAFDFQVFDDRLGDFGDVPARQPAEAFDVHAVLVERGDDGQAVLFVELIVLGAAARGDVDDAGALGLADLLPQDDAVRLLRRLRDVAEQTPQPRLGPAAGVLRGGQVVEGAAVRPALHLLAAQLAQHLERAFEHLGRALREIENFIALFDFHVRQRRPDGGGDVGGQRPRRRRPHEQRFTLTVEQREAQREAGVLLLDVALGHDLVLADAGSAAPAPRHHVRALVHPAVVMARLQEFPDVVIVLVAEGEVRAAELRQAELPDDLLDGAGDFAARPIHSDDCVRVLPQPVVQKAQRRGVVPIHPHPQADGLLGLHGGEVEHALFAQHDERRQAVFLDVFFRFETEVFLDVDLHPQALAIEAVLPALVVAGHGTIALKQILVRAAPRVMHAHRVVGGDGAIHERPRLVALRAQPAQLIERIGVLPPLQRRALHVGEVGVGGNRLEHEGPFATNCANFTNE